MWLAAACSVQNPLIEGSRSRNTMKNYVAEAIFTTVILLIFIIIIKIGSKLYK